MSLTGVDFITSIETVTADSFQDDTERFKAKVAVSKLLSRLETPWETTVNMVWIQPALSACLKTCIDCDLFQQWLNVGGGPKSGTDLSRLAGIDPILMRRMLRHMGAANALKEVGEDSYEMTPFSSSLAMPGHSNCMNHLMDVNYPGFRHLPLFLADRTYQNPTSLSDSNWPPAIGTDKTFFEWLAVNPKIGQDFQNLMMAASASKLRLDEIYPLDRLLTGWNKSQPLIVDVGGSSGHDIRNLDLQHRDLPPGSLVLQDLKGPIATAEVQDSIKTMVYDFFEPQPIKGARAYYLHCVLHNWPDDRATEILKNLSSAMVPGYSKILIHENVINATNPHPHTTAVDLTMMMTFSAAERTEAMWNELIVKAGLKTVKVWRKPHAIESVIEVELP